MRSRYLTKRAGAAARLATAMRWKRWAVGRYRLTGSHVKAYGALYPGRDESGHLRKKAAQEFHARRDQLERGGWS